MEKAISTPREYRALMIFDKLPDGCVALPVMDQHSEPHIRLGEFVVVDKMDRTPRQGEVYVIGWQSGRYNICQARLAKARCQRRPEEPVWAVGSINNLTGRAVREWFDNPSPNARRIMGIPVFPGWSDGFFDADHLREKLIGCVIGIYAPSFEEPKRVEAVR